MAPEDRADVTVEVPVTGATADRWREAAQARGVTVSDLVRTAVESELSSGALQAARELLSCKRRGRTCSKRNPCDDQRGQRYDKGNAHYPVACLLSFQALSVPLIVGV